MIKATRTSSFLSFYWKLIPAIGLIIFLAIPAFSQTNKGDRPVKNGGKVREARFKSRSKQGDRARVKDVSGRRVRTKNSSSSSRAVIPYREPKGSKARYRNRDGDRAGSPVRPTYSSQPRDNQRAYTGPGGRVNARSATGRVSNVFPQFGRNNRNPSRTPRSTQHPTSNRAQLARLKKMQSDPAKIGGGRVSPRSASKAYIARKSVNPMARFSRGRRKKGDQATVKDLTGRPLRAKNYHTPQRAFIPSGNVYRGRKRVGDRSFQGRNGGGYKSATRNGQAWKGDITGRRVRGKNYSSRVNTGGSRIIGGGATLPRTGDRGAQRGIGRGARSATQSAESRTGTDPLRARQPGMGAWGLKGYSGDIKSKKQKKGGGSVGRNQWNNKGVPVPVRPPSNQTQRAGSFQGNIKGHREKKGGGSVGRNEWNNKGVPVPVRPPSNETQRAGSFQGNIKAHREKKGGGSVSGKLWNNNEAPIPVRPPSNETRRASSYPGGMKLFEAQPTLLDQGEEFTGYIRLKRFKKNYLKSPHQADEAIRKARPDKTTYRVNDLQVKVKQYNYIHNPSSAKEAVNVREPGKAFGRATDYQGNIKMKKFELFEKRNRALHPDAQFVKINKNNVPEERSFLTNIKLWWAKHFRKNENLPSSVKEKERKPRYDNGEQGLWND